MYVCRERLDEQLTETEKQLVTLLRTIDKKDKKMKVRRTFTLAPCNTKPRSGE